MPDTATTRDTLIRTERVKLTAAYLNTAAGGGVALWARHSA